MIYVEVDGSSIYSEGLRIEDAITSSPNTASFSMLAPTVEPVAGMSVLIYRGTVANTLFGGLIVEVQKSMIGPNQTVANIPYRYDILAEDYQQLLNERLVVQTYTSQTCLQIIQDFVTNFTDAAHGITTTNVSTGPTITDIRFSYVKVQDAIIELANLVNYDWYMDSDKDIHFFEKETLPAPFTIDDTALKEYIFNFTITPDYTQVRNCVYVRGGYYLSTARAFSWVADGSARTWPLGYAPHAPTTLTVNGVPATFALDNLNADDGTYEYFWSYQEKYLRCAENAGTTTTPAAGQVIVFTYQFEVPILVRADNTVSQAAIAAIRGGDGVIESIIKDDSIDSKDIAQDRAIAEVNQFGNAWITGSFDTFEHGFASGQFVELDVSNYESFDGKYQIKRVSTQILGAGNPVYHIEFATTLYELKDLLSAFIRESKRIKLREDETVDVLKLVSESITLTDTTATLLTAHPVKWDQFQWGLATWG